jgi:hypothetical protein
MKPQWHPLPRPVKSAGVRSTPVRRFSGLRTMMTFPGPLTGGLLHKEILVPAAAAWACSGEGSQR